MVETAWSEILIPTINDILSFQYVLPFILFIAIVFSILDGKGIISKKKPINMLVAIIVSIMSMMSPIGPSLASFFGTFAGRIGVYMVGLMLSLMVIMVLYEAISKSRGERASHEKLARWVFKISMVVVIALFITSGGLSILGLNLVIPVISPSVIVYVGVYGFIISFFAFLYWIGSKEQREKKREKRERTRHERERLERLLGIER